MLLKKINKASSQIKFDQWFVGVIDASGEFDFGRLKNKEWYFSFEITQNPKNLALLFYICNKLKIGFVRSTNFDKKNIENLRNQEFNKIYINKLKNNEKAYVYSLQSKTQIQKVILPTLEEYLPRTSKLYSQFRMLKKAFEILDDELLSQSKKDFDLSMLWYKKEKLKQQLGCLESPIWENINYSILNEISLSQILSKSWIIGFIEGKNSTFSIKNPARGRTFRWELRDSNKSNKIILKSIAIILGCLSREFPNGDFIVFASNQKVKILMDYFQDVFKGRNKRIFAVWCLGYDKYILPKQKRNYPAADKAAKLIQKLKDDKKRLDNYNKACFNMYLKEQTLNVDSIKFTKILDASNSFDFNEWLTGFTDGDGGFYFHPREDGSWSFAFKISQARYNIRVLCYILSQLKVGSIHPKSREDNDIVNDNKINQIEFEGSLDQDDNEQGEFVDSYKHYVFSIQDREILQNIIIPLFEKYPPRTGKKYYDFTQLKKALAISLNSSFSKVERNNLLLELWENKKNVNQKDLVSIVWETFKNFSEDDVEIHRYAKLVLSKSWVLGFTEAEGSFSLQKNNKTNFKYFWALPQVLDIIVLKALAATLLLNAPRSVSRKKYGPYWTVEATNETGVKFVLEYFQGIKMRGMKSTEYKIWSKAFLKDGASQNTPIHREKTLIRLRALRKRIRPILSTKTFNLFFTNRKNPNSPNSKKSSSFFYFF